MPYLYIHYVCRAYGAFTLESILAAAFGRVIDLQRGEADEVTRAAKAVFDDGRGKLLLVALFFTCRFITETYQHKKYNEWLLFAATVPFLRPLLDYYLTNFTNIVEPWKVIHHTALKLIEARRAGTAKPAKVRLHHTFFILVHGQWKYCISTSVIVQGHAPVDDWCFRWCSW